MDCSILMEFLLILGLRFNIIVIVMFAILLWYRVRYHNWLTRLYWKAITEVTQSNYWPITDPAWRHGVTFSILVQRQQSITIDDLFKKASSSSHQPPPTQSISGALPPKLQDPENTAFKRYGVQSLAHNHSCGSRRQFWKAFNCDTYIVLKQYIFTE